MKKLIVMVVTAALIAGCAGNAAMMKKEMAANAIAGNVGRIVIYRPSAFAAGGAKNDILIDGELVTVLASGIFFIKMSSRANTILKQRISQIEPLRHIKDLNLTQKNNKDSMN